MDTQIKRYLGDSVYADFNGFHIVLTTENGVEISNTIFLELEVFEELKRFVNDLTGTTKEE